MERKICQFEFKADTETGTFEGYGAVFNNVDYGNDIIMPGAFAKTIADIKATGRVIPALWQHNSDEPIGKYTDLAEDAKGLYVKGKLLTKVPLGAAAAELMKEGIVSGLSIGYGTIESSTDDQTYIRTLKELDLYEISPVTFPMNDAARVTSAKRKGAYRPAPKAFEDFLGELGFSKSEAAVITNRGYSHLLRSESAGNEDTVKQIAAALQSFKLTPIGA